MFKNFFLLFRVENLKSTIKRFPIPFTLIIATTILFLIYNKIGHLGNGYDTMIGRSVFTFILVFFLSLGVYLSTEDSKLINSKKSLFHLFPPLFGVLFYYFFNLDFSYYDNLILFIVCLVGISSYVFFAPYLTKLCGKKINNKLYFQYIYKTAIVFIFGFLLGGMLFALGTLAIWAVETLFDLHWSLSNDFYSNWAIIALSFVTPIVCLMEIPTKNQVEDKKFDVNTFFSFIIKYVFNIFFVVYFIILYAYSIKVLLNFGDWPKDQICWLVVVFSSFAYISYTASYYFDNSIKAIGIIRKATPYVVIPQVFMLFYAIYLRINQYDLTVNRYFVVVFGLWLLVISFYFIFSKNKSLLAIPTILTLFTIIVSIGPWSVFILPETRQYNRLVENLEKAGILVNGEIVPLNDYSDIDKNLSREIYNGISYVCYNSKDCSKIKKLFGREEKSDNKWGIIQGITDEIKVKTYYSYEATESPYRYISVSGDIFPLKTEGFDYIVKVQSKNQNDFSNNVFKNLSIAIDLTQDVLYVIENNKIQETISTGIIKNLQTRKPDTNGAEYVEKFETFSKKDLTFEFKTTKYEIKLFVSNASIENPNYTGESAIDPYYYLDGYALMKEL